MKKYLSSFLVLSHLLVSGQAYGWGVTIGPIKIKSTKKTPLHSIQDKAGKVIDKTGDALEKAKDDIGDVLENTRDDVGDVLEVARDDTVKILKEAVNDTVEEIERTGEHTKGAVVASANFLENQLESMGDTLSDAERRVAQGKFVDAVWHIAVDPVRHSEENFAKAVTDSSLLNNMATAAASIYGGSAGAAAYAAWYTYRQTGDLEVALKAGVIAGATKEGLAMVNGMPSETTDELLKKTLASASIGGAAVAASGGDEEEVIKAFVKGAAYTAAREHYNNMTREEIEGRAPTKGFIPKPKLDPGIDHEYTILVDENGTPILDASGKYLQIDIRALPKDASHVGLATTDADTSFFSGAESSVPMKAIAKLPYMNDMAYYHDQWSAVAQFEGLSVQSTIIPALALTVIGSDTPLMNQIIKTNINRKKGVYAQKAPNQQKVVNKTENMLKPADERSVAGEYSSSIAQITDHDLNEFTDKEKAYYRKFQSNIGKVRKELTDAGLGDVVYRSGFNANIYKNFILASLNPEKRKWLIIRAKQYISRGYNFKSELPEKIRQEYINVWNNSTYNNHVLSSMGRKTVAMLKDRNIHPEMFDYESELAISNKYNEYLTRIDSAGSDVFTEKEKKLFSIYRKNIGDIRRSVEIAGYRDIIYGSAYDGNVYKLFIWASIDQKNIVNIYRWGDWVRSNNIRYKQGLPGETVKQALRDAIKTSTVIPDEYRGVANKTTMLLKKYGVHPSMEM